MATWMPWNMATRPPGTCDARRLTFRRRADAAASRLRGLSTQQPRRCRDAPPRTIHAAPAASPRGASADYPRGARSVAATRLHGLSTRRPRRRRDAPPRTIRAAAAASPPRTIHAAAAASPRLVCAESPRGSRGVAATGRRMPARQRRTPEAATPKSAPTRIGQHQLPMMAGTESSNEQMLTASDCRVSPSASTSVSRGLCGGTPVVPRCRRVDLAASGRAGRGGGVAAPPRPVDRAVFGHAGRGGAPAPRRVRRPRRDRGPLAHFDAGGLLLHIPRRRGLSVEALLLLSRRLLALLVEERFLHRVALAVLRPPRRTA